MKPIPAKLTVAATALLNSDSRSVSAATDIKILTDESDYIKDPLSQRQRAQKDLGTVIPAALWGKTSMTTFFFNT